VGQVAVLALLVQGTEEQVLHRVGLVVVAVVAVQARLLFIIGVNII
jgi:hypothetical protein